MPRRRLVAFAAAVSMLAASAAPTLAQDDRPLGPPDATPNPVALETPAGDGTAIRLVTEFGDIVIGLFTESAPVAAENFLNLATRGYYDDVGFHRAVPGFVLQGGDPEGTGAGGPGYTIRDEEVVGRYGRGIVAMARTQAPDSQGSQFFIVLDDAAEAPLESFRTYTIFGRVVEGMDVVDAIVGAREPSDRIPDPVRIIETSVEQVELPPEPTPAPPTEAQLAAQALGERLPSSAGGFELQQATFTLEEVGAQLDADILAELEAIAAEEGTDLQRFVVGQASGGDASDFVSIAAASLPGVPAERILDPIMRLLLPDAPAADRSEQVIGGRTVTRVQLGAPQAAWVFASDEIVWFVVTTLEDREDVGEIISSLP